MVVQCRAIYAGDHSELNNWNCNSNVIFHKQTLTLNRYEFFFSSSSYIQTFRRFFSFLHISGATSSEFPEEKYKLPMNINNIQNQNALQM